MRISWRGHASFVIEAEGRTIVTDPFNEKLGYPVTPLAADIAIISHQHWDHNAVEILTGQPQVIMEPGAHKVGGITITGLNCWHDANGGRERGLNTAYKISAEGLEVVHLGDLGHTLDSRQVAELGQVDVLMVPVGGRYTIDAEQAVKVVKDLQPRIAIPMHFGTPHLSFALAPVEKFISYYDTAVKKAFLEVTPETLGNDLRIILLDYLNTVA
ncbi:MAG: MBL fold metallo-hydrolase [Syntrophomonadaceae bacterium]|nr:MBL fold metallo-hydrolase [Syntrophomonadaceae bacterium]